MNIQLNFRMKRELWALVAALVLPVRERDLVEPGRIIVHVLVAIQLESYVQFIHGRRPCSVCPVYVVGHAVIGESNEDHLRCRALEFPRQVMPFKGAWRRAWDAG